ncbi:hypothetical protein KIL84_012928 [Mauremys mutica]|uniref:Uncharacterized protein n=1 Tax=Mauremys mutica TaxID=74926 RepID=A0A9D3XS14_9SAUR|nr:hypothetical protein KIL84_012928 [Mauremys mutica]
MIRHTQHSPAGSGLSEGRQALPQHRNPCLPRHAPGRKADASGMPESWNVTESLWPRHQPARCKAAGRGSEGDRLGRGPCHIGPAGREPEMPVPLPHANQTPGPGQSPQPGSSYLRVRRGGALCRCLHKLLYNQCGSLALGAEFTAQLPPQHGPCPPSPRSALFSPQRPAQPLANLQPPTPANPESMSIRWEQAP